MTATAAARFGHAGMRATVCEALAFLRFSGRTPVSESVIQVVKRFMQKWLQTTRDSLEQSVLPLLPDPRLVSDSRGTSAAASAGWTGSRRGSARWPF